MKYAYVLAASLFVAPAFANDTEDGTGLLFKNLLTGAGLLSKDKPDIDYRERAPLVLPPSAKTGNIALPAPLPPASSRNAQWPKDYDTEQAKKKPAVAVGYKRDSDRKLTPEEMKRGVFVERNQSAQQPAPAFDNRGNLFSRIGNKDADKLEFKGEGERTSLVQPPSGYRTPSANQPYGPVGQTDYTTKNPDPYKK